jgi:hypothetical protein
MVSWIRMMVGLFALTLILSLAIYFFGPRTFRESFHDSESPVGQIGVSGATHSRGKNDK